MNKKIERFHVKENGNGRKTCEKLSENNHQSNYEHEDKCNIIEEWSIGTTYLFINNKLRVIDEYSDFQ